MRKYKKGFTLTEVMIATGIMSLVLTGAFLVYITQNKLWHEIEIQLRANDYANRVLEKLIYGVERRCGLRSAYARSVSAVNEENGWKLWYTTVDDITNYVEFVRRENKIFYSNQYFSAFNKIGDYIVDSWVSNKIDGLEIMVKVIIVEGRFSGISEKRTYITYRN